MDRTNFYKKLAEISIDPPTDRNNIVTKRVNEPMKKMTYRETCIDYVKKTMRCANYRDYVVSELEKLEKIEQIVEQYQFYKFDGFLKIKEILEQE